VTAIAGGSLIAHYTTGYNASLTSTGAKIVTTRLGMTCVYETLNTEMGTATGGNPATLDIAAVIPINTAESSGLCGTKPTAMSGTYVGTGSAYYDA